jgi:hypothetical protein
MGLPLALLGLPFFQGSSQLTGLARAAIFAGDSQTN